MRRFVCTYLVMVEVIRYRVVELFLVCYGFMAKDSFELCIECLITRQN